MGRWMEVVRELRPKTGYDAQHRPAVPLAENAPHPLMNATGCLPQEARKLFPMLERISLAPGNWEYEEKILDKGDVAELLSELRRFRQLCRQQAFITGVRGDLLANYWRGREEEKEFEEWVDAIEDLLELTIRENCWLVISF